MSSLPAQMTVIAIRAPGGPEMLVPEQRAVEAHALPLVAAGKVKPVIDSTFPLSEAAAAHSRLEASAHIGKIVLTNS